MARAHTKCAVCNDLLWFADTDQAPQSVVCHCGATRLTEDGPEGGFIGLIQTEIDEIPN